MTSARYIKGYAVLFLYFSILYFIIIIVLNICVLEHNSGISYDIT